MDIEQIQDVQINDIFGSINFIVTLFDGTVAFVPVDPYNKDYSAVVEWLDNH